MGYSGGQFLFSWHLTSNFTSASHSLLIGQMEGRPDAATNGLLNRYLEHQCEESR